MLLRKWNYELREYERYRVPNEWNCRRYSDDLLEKINCCRCGKEAIYGYCFVSQELHDIDGFGFMVCRECHEVEMERKYKERTEE